MTTGNLEAIVIRYADHLMGRHVDTIAEHNRLFTVSSEVYVGKFGKPVKRAFIQKCCDENARVSLILVKKAKGPGEYEAYITRILHIQRNPPSPDSCPAYYRARADVSCWFRIKEPFTKMTSNELAKWTIMTSGLPLVESLSLSMSGFFYAYFGEPRVSSSNNKIRRGD